MSYVLLGCLILLLVVVGYQWARHRLGRGFLVSAARWGSAAVAVLITVLFALARRFDIAFFAGVAAFSIIARGQLGPISFRRDEIGSDNTSRVRSLFFDMTLDHDTGEVSGRVVSGNFQGADLLDLDEHETRQLIEEVSGDADSISLLETWLDANRSGWREYFAEAYGDGPGNEEQSAGNDPVADALEVLGLERGASADEIRAAHRKLMKAVHPDHGGSAYLASRINEARDLLLDLERKS
ncbi:hypothetical protein GCM10007989_03860 [Devosia pacifica]|uniref:J domain-containing protein n=1 Tax=Devosia pacifica TaxID=1335967 RepID=A0A918VP27_9HYPH|nr:DnaJ domain-containing protein [Devosia pacifica]GHA12612.1 hypothetical protein GCM10007989_03860 [Devosia pacifica]